MSFRLPAPCGGGVLKYSTGRAATSDSNTVRKPQACQRAEASASCLNVAILVQGPTLHTGVPLSQAGLVRVLPRDVVFN